MFPQQQKDDHIQPCTDGSGWRRRGMEGTISSSSLNRCDYISGLSGVMREGIRQEVAVGEIRGGQIMTSSKTEVEWSL